MALIYILIAFDLMVRLPIVLRAETSAELSADVIYDLFADYRPEDVINTGLFIELLGFFCIVFAFIVVNASLFRVKAVPHTSARGRLVIKPTFYVFLGFCLLAAVLAFQAIGFSEILRNLSAKRDLGLGDGNITTYLLLKIAFANHIFAMILLAIYLEQKRTSHLLMLFVVTVFIFLTGIVFSQRQSIIIYMFEIIIILLYYGQATKTRMMVFGAAFLVIIIATTVLRGESGAEGIGEALALFEQKVISSRYFFDFTKNGIIAVWHETTTVQPSLIFGFIPEMIWPDQTLNNKQFGYMIADEIFPLRNPGGVTTGVLIDSFITLGYMLGAVFLLLAFAVLFKTEKSFFRQDFSIVRIYVIAKIIILINSSIDSFIFAILLELPLLLLIRLTIVRRA
jgi:hypothetical protein